MASDVAALEPLLRYRSVQGEAEFRGPVQQFPALRLVRRHGLGQGRPGAFRQQAEQEQVGNPGRA